MAENEVAGDYEGSLTGSLVLVIDVGVAERVLSKLVLLGVLTNNVGRIKAIHKFNFICFAGV